MTDEVKRLAKEYGMPESYVRHMLAIERGEITGDVIDCPEPGPIVRYHREASSVIAAGIVGGLVAAVVGWPIWAGFVGMAGITFVACAVAITNRESH